MAGGGPAARERIATLLKDAAVAAAVAFALALPLIGFRTVDTGGVLGIETRFDWVGIGVAAVFVGRLALGLFRRRPKRPAAPAARIRLRDALMPHRLWLGALALALAFALPFLPFANRYVVDVATTVLIYVMLGWGLNVVVGLAGLLDLGYVAFYAIGAYTTALLGAYFGLSFWECLPLAGLTAAAAGVLLGFPVLRLRGDYLAIVTLGFGEMIRIVLINWVSLTKGPDGVKNVPRPSFFGLKFTRTPEAGETAFHEFFGLDYATEHRVIFLYFVILALALVTNAFTLRLRRLPVGRAWEALREDEIASRALGINPATTKLTAFAVGAMLGGFAGSFFAARQGFISPESFTFMESATILAIVVLGGLGSQVGVVFAAILLVVLPEIGREFAEFRMLLFGGAMVAIIIWRPGGLLGRREPSARLGSAAAPLPVKP